MEVIKDLEMGDDRVALNAVPSVLIRRRQRAIGRPHKRRRPDGRGDRDWCDVATAKKCLEEAKNGSSPRLQGEHGPPTPSVQPSDTGIEAVRQ